MFKNQHESPIKTMREKHTFAYVCYRCNKPGHFIKDCPETTPKRSPISGPPPPCSSTTIDPQFPTTHCRCGSGVCEIRVSASSKNPGRKYYRCPGKFDKNCGYFEWCDKLREDEIRKSQPELNFPTCGCGAGICTVRVEESGPNAGRSYFACPIKKGDGACSFRQWLDDSPHSVLINPQGAASEQNILLDEFDLSYEEAMQIDALEMGACEPPLEQVQIQTEGDEGDKMTDKANEPSAEVHPHPVQNDVSNNALDSEFTNRNTMDENTAMENTQASVTTVATFHDPVSRDHLIDILLQFFKAYFFQEPGSPGKFADTPRRVKISAMNPVIMSTIPNFDQVNMPKENESTPSVILEDSSEEGFEASPSLDDQSWSGLILSPSGLLKDGLHEGSSMSITILQAFEKLAHNIRDKLITLLDSMDPRDHEIMLKEAKCTFAALDHLQVDYGLFRMRVTEYINQATVLAHIEQTINEDTSSKELINRFNDEKSRFDEVQDAYCNANDAYKASSEKVSLLHKNASYFKDLEVEIEKELACCEMERPSAVRPWTRSLRPCLSALTTYKLLSRRLQSP